MSRQTLLLLVVLSASLLSVPGQVVGAIADGVWIEGEKPMFVPEPAKVISAEKGQFLSEGHWLTVLLDAREAEKSLPAGGLTFAYPFQTSRAAKQAVWARIGFEFARSPFDWRIDGGPWKTVQPQDLTCDLYALAFFNEVAWLKLDDADLPAGPHKIEFRVTAWKNAKGESQRALFGLDAIYITTESFIPNGKFKPGDQWREEIDRKAEQTVFEFPDAAATPGVQTALRLAGLWQIARHDEQLPKEVAAPIADFPEHPFWKGIPVPGDKGELRPDLLFAHRVWYRTKVNIPATWSGRSFFLAFPGNNLNTTLYVNGKFCGFDKNPFVRLQFDITSAVKPGVNEFWVGIRDAWYGYVTDPKDPLRLRRRWNTPAAVLSRGFQELVYPIWNQKASGIIGTPELVAAGPVYTADVFVKPSVARKQLGLEVTLKNPGRQGVSGELLCEAVDDRSGQAEWHAPSQAFTLDPEKEQVLDFAPKWENPKLWWPDDPNCYRLRTTVKIGGKPVDLRETLFGFREWTWQGRDMKLNGVRWQGFSEQGNPGKTPETWIVAQKSPKINHGFGRMWPQHDGAQQWLGKEFQEALDFMDRHGALVRPTGYLDGEACGYMPAVFPELGRNWLDHLAGWIRSHRNHPCIFMWSIENEMNFINACNLGQLKVWEPILTQAWEIAQKVDPTRPIMIDGGGATLAQTLPLHGDHYTTKPFWNYPQLAYEANATCRNWTWDEQRPKFIGEELFAAGINPAYAYFGGEQVFLGKVGNRPAVGKAMQILSEGYRWYGISGCDFCQQPTDSDGSQYNSWAPRAVFIRQWDYTFASGRKATRTFGIFNNTRFDDPITFTWRLTLNGPEIATKTTEHKVAPGESEKFDVEIAMPTVAARQEGELVLTLTAGGKEVFRSVKAISVLPVPALKAQLKAGELVLYDPKGKVSPTLQACGIPFTAQSSLAPPSAAGKIWLIGPDALEPAESTSSAFASYALGGGRVLVLEQENPLRYQGLIPAEIESQQNVGRTAFAEDLDHPLLCGLKDKDFFTWEPGEVVYKNAYLKPQRGARSLVQCNESLVNSALLTIPVGPGLITLCQLVVGEKAAENITAKILLLNALDYSATYRLDYLATAAAVDPALRKVLDSINLQHAVASDPLDAMAKGKIAVVSATPENLKTLASHADRLKAFDEAGGWLVLCGLGPEGLPDYNRIVGFDHMIRPFRRERVSIAIPRNRLLSGVSLSDVALYSSERIFAWQDGNFVASDTFGHVVDLEDIAPFGRWDKEVYLQFVNGMTQEDGWKYILNHPAADDTYTLTFERPQEVVAWTWDGNTFYNRTSKVDFIVDNNEAGKRTFDVSENGDAITLPLDPPMTGSVFSFRHAKYTDLPEKRQKGVTLIGCDNISLFARRPAGFRQQVRPLLNIGGLVEYPRGRGGILLCNLLFKDNEEVPVNGVKKRSVLASLLRNLGAPFGGGRPIIAGANLAYWPIAIDKHANQFRTEAGWFADRRFTLRDLPAGEQTLAGVKYDIYEFRTSPVPTCIMLGGPGIPHHPAEEVRGIPVGRKADALFFLHTARIDRKMQSDDWKKGKRYEMLRYIVHYADAKDEVLPIYCEIDIGDFKTKTPVPLSGAQLAWTKRYEGTEFHSTVYSKQWNNPRPDVEIQSIDMVYGPDKRGVPALLAVTAATCVPKLDQGTR